jgi:hypothetical protein
MGSPWTPPGRLAASVRTFCGGYVANSEEGVRRIGLKVAVENDHALGLCSSLGFIQTTTEDNHELPLS